MKVKLYNTVFLLLTPLLCSATEIDHQDPRIRSAILNHGDSMFTKGEYKEAARYYLAGINYWIDESQRNDQEKACKSLFAMFYYLKIHEKNKDLLKNCPVTLYDNWYGKEDKAPVAVMKIPHEYPQEALAESLEGWVIVEFYVTNKGETADVRISESSNPVFDGAALDAAGKYLYLPAIRDGKAVKSKLLKNRLTFRLK